MLKEIERVFFSPAFLLTLSHNLWSNCKHEARIPMMGYGYILVILCNVMVEY